MAVPEIRLGKRLVDLVHAFLRNLEYRQFLVRLRKHIDPAAGAQTLASSMFFGNRNRVDPPGFRLVPVEEGQTARKPRGRRSHRRQSRTPGYSSRRPRRDTSSATQASLLLIQRITSTAGPRTQTPACMGDGRFLKAQQATRHSWIRLDFRVLVGTIGPSVNVNFHAAIMAVRSLPTGDSAATGPALRLTESCPNLHFWPESTLAPRTSRRLSLTPPAVFRPAPALRHLHITLSPAGPTTNRMNCGRAR